MKYENFETAKSIVEKIKKKQELFDELCVDNIHVILFDANVSVRITTIGVGGSYEHEFSAKAVEFIEDMKTNLAEKIKRLNAELEQC